MKIATWNVNSLRMRLAQVLEWLAAEKPDILALQETKLPDEAFPAADIEAAGYHAIYLGQKTYNGVALLTRGSAHDVVHDLPGLDDPARRVLGATCGPVRVLNLYVPNGEAVESPKYAYKLKWLDKLVGYIAAQLIEHAHLVVVGDFNIAPEDRDVHDPAEWAGKVLCSEPERAAFRCLLAAGLRDTFRLFEQEAGHYTWWDYRMNAFRRKRGLRIDHILVSTALAKRCTACRIDREPRARARPSDHTPVIAEFNL
jgi:exodeoxyribonuclease III